MHGSLSLTTPLPHLETSLMNDFKDKTVVILDNEFAVTAGSINVQKARSMDYFRKDEFIKAATEHNIHFVVCSSNNYGYLQWVAELSEP